MAVVAAAGVYDISETKFFKFLRPFANLQGHKDC